MSETYNPVAYVDHMGDDFSIARAARVSTGKDDLPEGYNPAGLINYLMREGHTSPFEHTSLTVRIETPIFIARQIMRHRHFSYNEVSGRYTDVDEPRFYLPEKGRPLRNAGTGAHPDLVDDDSIDRRVVDDVLDHAAEVALDYYDHLRDLGVASEVARAVLPLGMHTKFYMTGNLHAWFHFFNLRSGRTGHPQHEIQEVSREVEKIVYEHFPNAFDAWSNTWPEEDTAMF